MRNLFKEYALMLDVDLEFQNFGKEIKNLEVIYSKPYGVAFLITENYNNPIGCFAIRRFEDAICELKRMYIKIEFRRLGIGEKMIKRAIKEGKRLGYKKIRLDTLPKMNAAINLYRKVGFYEIQPYRFNPIEGTKYFEIGL